jgi:hypothetical protein
MIRPLMESEAGRPRVRNLPARFHALSTTVESLLGYGMRNRSFLILILKPIPCGDPRSSQGEIWLTPLQANIAPFRNATTVKSHLVQTSCRRAAAKLLTKDEVRRIASKKSQSCRWYLSYADATPDLRRARQFESLRDLFAISPALPRAWAACVGNFAIRLFPRRAMRVWRQREPSVA